MLEFTPLVVAEATGRPGFIVPGLLAAVVAELNEPRFSHDLPTGGH